jgi:hypothetical protein
MKFLVCESLLADILILNCIPGESRDNLNMPLFIYYCGIFMILILLACNDQKVVRINTYGTPDIIAFGFILL